MHALVCTYLQSSLSPKSTATSLFVFLPLFCQQEDVRTAKRCEVKKSQRALSVRLSSLCFSLCHMVRQRRLPGLPWTQPGDKCTLCWLRSRDRPFENDARDWSKPFTDKQNVLVDASP